MKILMTGGAGYVGSACLRWLLGHGHDPIAYDNLLEGNIAAVPDAASRLIIGDIAETDRLAEILRQHRVEAVMHFAALASVPDSISDPEAYYRVNVGGTKSVLDAMRATGVRKILFSSTAATYGFHAEMPLREELASNARNSVWKHETCRRVAHQGLRPGLRLGLHLAALLQRLRRRPRWQLRRKSPT